MYGNTSAGVVVGGVLLSGSFYMCPTVECILCSENVWGAERKGWFNKHND